MNNLMHESMAFWVNLYFMISHSIYSNFSQCSRKMKKYGTNDLVLPKYAVNNRVNAQSTICSYKENTWFAGATPRTIRCTILHFFINWNHYNYLRFFIFWLIYFIEAIAHTAQGLTTNLIWFINNLKTFMYRCIIGTMTFLMTYFSCFPAES